MSVRSQLASGGSSGSEGNGGGGASTAGSGGGGARARPALAAEEGGRGGGSSARVGLGAGGGGGGLSDLRPEEAFGLRGGGSPRGAARGGGCGGGLSPGETGRGAGFAASAGAGAQRGPLDAAPLERCGGEARSRRAARPEVDVHVGLGARGMPKYFSRHSSIRISGSDPYIHAAPRGEGQLVERHFEVDARDDHAQGASSPYSRWGWP